MMKQGIWEALEVKAVHAGRLLDAITDINGC
jgi:hypothetical protein